MELAARAPGLVGARADARDRRGRPLRPSPAEHPASRADPRATPSAATAPELEDLWDRHGGSVYALACALLGTRWQLPGP